MSVPTGPGLAQERTAFAWRRTALSVAVGSLLCLRVLPPQLGPTGWVLAVLGLCWSADLAATGWRRQHDLDGALRSGSAPAHVGTALVRTAAITVTVGVVALVAAVVIAGRTFSG